MVVKRLYIKNFRCFGDEAVVINFSKTGLMAFVGCNNAGKSTALKAVEILLGDKWPVSQFFEDDFHQKDTSKNIVLACEFSTPILIPAMKGSEDTTSIIGLVIDVGYLETGYGQSATEVTFQLISSINCFEEEDWTIACYPGGRGKTMFVSQEIRNLLPIAITIPLIKLQSEQPTNKWGVLGRMLQKVENSFAQDEEKKDRFNDSISESMAILREPVLFSSLESDISTFWSSVKPNNLSGTSLEFLDYDPWHYYRQFRLAITKNGVDVPLDSLGEGVQRLAVIALYRAYLKAHSRSQKAILLIEEPESYLHPQARSVVYQTLRKAVEGDDVEGQILYTTHSSDFIDCANFEEIANFAETENSSQVRQVSKTALMEQTLALLGIPIAQQGDPSVYYRITEVDSFGLKDALFATKAVIVEGSTDLEFLKAFGKTEEKQISVVFAGGKNNIRSIYTFLTAFGVCCYIFTDRDDSDGTDNALITKLINEKTVNNLSDEDEDINSAEIDALAVGSRGTYRNLTVFSKNLESYLKKVIPDYDTLTETIKTTLNLGPSKSKLMFALGLCFQGKISAITPSADQKDAFDGVSLKLSEILSFEVKKPKLFLEE